MFREGLKKVKYPKGGEGSDFFCVLKFSIINIKYVGRGEQDFKQKMMC